jgi:hypothetical protein
VLLLAWAIAGCLLVSGAIVIAMAWLDISAPVRAHLPAGQRRDARGQPRGRARAFDLSHSLAENPMTWLLGAAGAIFALGRRRLWSNAVTPIVTISLLSGVAVCSRTRCPCARPTSRSCRSSRWWRVCSSRSCSPPQGGAGRRAR